MKHIVNIKELSLICKTNRSRIHKLIAEKRLKPDMTDMEGHCYWTQDHAKEIGEEILRQRESGKNCKGNPMRIP